MVQKSILTNTTQSLAKKYYQELLKANVPVSQMIIFGSHAKGNPKPWSDLDICVVSPIFGKNRYQEGVRLAILAHKVDDIIEPHPYHPKDLKEKWDPLAEQIRTTGKVVVVLQIRLKIPSQDLWIRL